MTDKESGIDPGKLAAGSKSLLSARTTKIRWKAEQNSKKYMSVLCFALPSFFCASFCCSDGEYQCTNGKHM